VFVAPLVAADRSRRTHSLQYTAKAGRAILRQQFAAVMISAFAVTTLIIAFFLGMVSRLGIQVLWNHGINSFMEMGAYWLPVTFGQYVIMMIGLIYLICMGYTALAFVLSRLSKNIMSLMLKIVPLWVWGAWVSRLCLGGFLGLRGNAEGPWLTLSAGPVLLVLGWVSQI
jgi:hypothetical protein